MRANRLTLFCLALAPALASCSTSAPETQWGRQARQQCDRQYDPRTRDECYRRVEEAERQGQTPAQ